MQTPFDVVHARHSGLDASVPSWIPTCVLSATPTLATLVVLLLHVSPATGQTSTPIAVPSQDPLAAVTLDTVAGIGSTADPVLMGPMSKFAAGSSHYYAQDVDGSTVIVFDTNGRFVRTFAREGRGPGEIHRLSGIRVGAGDSVFLAQANIVSVYSPAHEFVRDFPLPAATFVSFVPMSADTYLFAALPIGDETPQPLHFLSPNGRRLRSFGWDDDVMGPACRTCRIMLPDGSARLRTTIWTYTRYQFGIQEWTREGQLLRRFQFVEAGWPPITGSADSPHPAISGITVDSSGMLWIVVERPLPPDSVARPLDATIGGQRAVLLPQPGWDELIRIERAQSTIIGAFDPNTGRLVAQGHLRGRFMMLPDGLVFRRVADTDGYVFIEVYRPRVQAGIDSTNGGSR